ncbi:MAG: uncharacterized protein QOJ26_1843, partial [Thermoplasmata archaeon]|nr:uncharacterized protein [Thermoplasmata archaeon]
LGAGVAKRLPQPKKWEYVRVGRSKLHGRGLFAARDLPKGTCVMEYLGERVTKKEGNRRTDEQWAQGRVYTFELSTRVDLDGKVRSNIARLANFSCDPNCESFNEDSRRIWIRAMRDIKEGEEITYDYCFPLIEPPPVCRCGAKKCRGYIVGEEHAAELKEWLEKQAEAAALEKAHHHAPRAKRRKA